MDAWCSVWVPDSNVRDLHLIYGRATSRSTQAFLAIKLLFLVPICGESAFVSAPSLILTCQGRTVQQVQC